MKTQFHSGYSPAILKETSKVRIPVRLYQSASSGSGLSPDSIRNTSSPILDDALPTTQNPRVVHSSNFYLQSSKMQANSKSEEAPVSVALPTAQEDQPVTEVNSPPGTEISDISTRADICLRFYKLMYNIEIIY